jgi:biopolymer transport protein ExbD
LINAQGEVMLDDTPTPLTQIKGIIEEKLARNPNLIVSVKTDENTDYWVYVRVLDQLKQANASRISIAEPEK